jgi:hypothetical protein
VKVLSPEPVVYNVSSVPLVFTVSEPTSGIAYCLDGGANVSVGGNATLSGLEGGRHSLVVYATDRVGNVGVSETRIFEVNTPNPFPTTLVAIAIAILLAVVSIGLAVYYVKAKRKKATRRQYP